MQSSSAPPPSGCWYELEAALAPAAAVQGEEEPLPACRVLECRDMHDGRVLNRNFVDPPPAALKAEEITGCLLEAIRRHGPPQAGVFISPSARLSSWDMLLFEETRKQGRQLFESGLNFPALKWSERGELQSWAARRGLHCEFDRERLCG